TGVSGDVVTVKGDGYKATETIQIDFGTCYTIATTTASTRGTFSATFIVNNQEGGIKQITATGLESALEQNPSFMTNIFKIIGKIYNVWPQSGIVGSEIAVEGSGFQQNETVTVHFGTSQTITTTTVNNSNGTFSVTFIVDTQGYGLKTITAIGLQSNAVGITENAFLVKQNIYSINPFSDKVGEIVTVMGTGYGSGSIVSIDFGTHQTITTTTSNSNGTFSTTFRVNTQGYGFTTITARDIYDNATISFTIVSKIISIFPTYGPAYTWVTLEGTGYECRTGLETIRIDFGTHYTITTTTSSLNGTFSVTFRLEPPQSAEDGIDKIITATGLFSNTPATIGFDLTCNVWYLAPLSGPVGTEVVVKGAGYAIEPGNIREWIEISFGTHQTITTV
ncbi:MAG: hypothetical protein AAB296_03730, partial [Candidatus Desantisbacteria bacterium]